MNIDWAPLSLTFRLAVITTVLLLVIGVPLAYMLAFSRFRLKPVVETLVAMPLVLPPSVLGFYLLLTFSPQGAVGRFLADHFSLQFVFSFPGLVLGSLIFSLPFMVQPLQAGLEGLPASLTEAGDTLGKTRLTMLVRVLLPNVKPALLAGTVLSFAHTVGEFGVVLMIGGNIPGVTRVASLAIYDEVESLNYAAAHVYAGVLFAITFAILLAVYLINKRLPRPL